MRNITFQQVGMENFRGYCDPVVVDFPVGQLVLIYGPNGCLSGETEIDFPRDISSAERVKIKDLVDKEFFTYCYDRETNELKVKKAFNVRKTRKNAEVWKVTYTSETRKGFHCYDHIIGTPDHRILKSDGTYCQIKDLLVGDSLMSLYRRTYDGYTHIRTTGGEEYYEHKFIGEQLFGASDVVHHNDLNKFNNDPENLVPMAQREHYSWHANHLHNIGNFCYKEHPKGMSGKTHTENTKERISRSVKLSLQSVDMRKTNQEIWSKKNRNKLYVDKNILSTLYLVEEMSCVEIASIFNVTDVTIRNWLVKHNIPLRTLSEAQLVRVPNHTVVDVQFYDFEDTYNIEVDDCHNFVANGIFVANSGKTTMFESIPYTLYGILGNGARGSEDIVNNKVGKNCRTWLNFKIDDMPYRIERYQDYKKIGTSVHLFRGDDKVPYKKGQRDVTPEIERLFMPRKLFTNTILFGQRDKTFFTELPDSAQKEIFRKILQLDRYVGYEKNATATLNGYNDMVQEVKQKLEINNAIKQEIIIQVRNQERLQEQFQDDLNAAIASDEEQLTELRKTLEQKTDQFERISQRNPKEKSKELQVRIVEINEQVKTLWAEINNAKEEVQKQKETKSHEIRSQANEKLLKIQSDTNSIIKSRKSEIDEVVDTITNHQRELYGEMTKTHDMLSQMKAKDSQLLSKITEYTNALNKDEAICPTCDQPIDLKIKEKLSSDLQLLIKERGILEVDLKEYDEKYITLSKEYDTKSESVSKLKGEFTEFENSEEEKARKKVKEIDGRVAEAMSKIDALADKKLVELVQDKRNKINELEEEVEKANVEHTKYENEVSDLMNTESEIKQTEMEIRMLTKALEEKKAEEFDTSSLDMHRKKLEDIEASEKELSDSLPELEKKARIAMFWKIAFSPIGIPSMLIDESIPFMNSQIAEYLGNISGGRYTVSFDTMKATKKGEFRDKISINVFDNKSWANSKLQFSGGQVRIVDIATILTLRSLQNNIQNMSFNLLLFDEIFDSLDEENIEYVSRLLNSMKEGKTIFVISHKHIDQLEADQILRVSN